MGYEAVFEREHERACRYIELSLNYTRAKLARTRAWEQLLWGYLCSDTGRLYGMPASMPSLTNGEPYGPYKWRNASNYGKTVLNSDF